MTTAAIRPLRSRAGALTALFAALLAILLSAFPAAAQSQLILESDDLVYDYDADVISAVGNVVARYNGYVLSTDRLTYFQTTGRLVAVGNVRVIDTNGNIFEAAQLDVTDDFGDGFIEQLTVTTPDRTFFTAENARRYEGRINEFFNSTYTACEPRLNDRERPPLWNVRAARIIYNEEEEMVYFEQARLELFGAPIAYLPRFATPAPDVTRATGFLFPEFSLSSTRGFGVSVPFFWALAPNYDLTITPSYFTGGAFMTELEWRHRLERGIYTVEAAGIYETDPANLRGGVRTTGAFSFGRFWSLGWDGTLLSDRGLAQTYDTLNPSGSFVTSTVQVTGLRDRAFVEAQVYHFRDVRDLAPRTEQARQAVGRPVVDHDVILDRPILGGEVRLTGNLTSLSRGANDPFDINGTDYFYGLAGTYTRLSEQVSWRREFLLPNGQVVMPFVFARADLYALDLDAPPPGMADGFVARLSAGAGVEWRWPFLIIGPNSRHIIEPVVQVIARPDEQRIGRLPNEDAQSLVFDTTNLLAWDRFSGWDRAEGGTRLTLGLRYTGEFGFGTIEGAIGQSFQIAGANSFATTDLNGTGIGAGLDEGRRSDLVAAVSLTANNGNSVSATARFDGATYDLERGTIAGTATIGPVQASAGLAYDRSRFDLEGEPNRALTVTTAAAVELGPKWTLSGGLGYDIVNGMIVSNFIGLSYACECATMDIRYSATRSPGTDVVNRTVMFGLQLRTLGDFNLDRTE